ncbi:MAG TPA: hypothetical protein VHB70_08490 [Parafilimonas sp.]|nr:hypothetical protein [Parafilimonas sp.]
MRKHKFTSLEEQLENMEVPGIKSAQHRQDLKLTIINTKKSARISLWLLLLPVLILLEGFIESAFHVFLPPWSWIIKYTPVMPVWLRVAIFTFVLILIPTIAVLINVLGILWFRYDKAEHVLHIAVRMRRINVIIIVVAGILALLFIGHSIAEWITNGE